MNKIDLIKSLERDVRKAKECLIEFNKTLNLTEKRGISKDFQSYIFSFLDYLYTNFPTDRKKLENYFPRPLYNASEKDYLKRVSSFKKSKNGPEIIVPLKMIEFLQKFFKINAKYGYPIAFLDGIVKHETPNEFGEGWSIELSGTFDKSLTNSIWINSQNESINIGPISFQGDSGHQDLLISIGNETISIPHLKLTNKPDERDIVSLRGKKYKFNTWCNDCIQVMEEALIEFKENRY